MNSLVSGALDRLHYEKDPCVRFDTDKKMWLYLHKERPLENWDSRAASIAQAAATPNPRMPQSLAPICSTSSVDELQPIATPSQPKSNVR